jgi:hypothetical protein
MVLVALAMAAQSASSPWPNVLPDAAVASQVTGVAAKVLVAGAGGDAAERDGAADQVVAALRTAPNVKLVIGDDALGDLSTADDPTVIGKARAQPVDQIFVVRVFPQDGGWSVVVIGARQMEERWLVT